MKSKLKNIILKWKNYKIKMEKEIKKIRAIDVIIGALFILSIDTNRPLTYWSKYFNYYYDYFPLFFLIIFEIILLSIFIGAKYYEECDGNILFLIYRNKLILMIFILLFHIFLLMYTTYR